MSVTPKDQSPHKNGTLRMINPDGVLAVKVFSISAISFFITETVCALTYFRAPAWLDGIIIAILITYLLSIVVALKIFYSGNDFQISIRAAILGCIFALGLSVHINTPPDFRAFGAYMCVMSFFHFSEFVAIAIVQPKELSVNSFILNHSPQYIAAAVSSWVEFILEYYFLDGFKQKYLWLSYIGLIVCIGGELLRKGSMLTAGSSFNHLVVYERPADHELVTHGVYAWFRHPSYVGWFYWSIGTQVVLLNPVCVVAYAAASWAFFRGRIYMEEITLIHFYGQHYCDYQEKVATGIPFIKGYRIK